MLNLNRNDRADERRTLEPVHADEGESEGKQWSGWLVLFLRVMAGLSLCKGLYHSAILYPTRPALADALRRLIAAKVPLDGASDHGVSEALYLRDPDENGVELYWDRPREQWPKNADGSLAMKTEWLYLEDLLKEKLLA